MKLNIRLEIENDHRAVENLNREAFWNLYFPGCIEHYLVNQMRPHPDFLPELSYVAELDGKLLGSILYTRGWLVNTAAEEREVISFGPLSVLPGYQRQGIGGALIRHTLDLARQQGETGVVIFGDPHNYCKHGFRNAKDLGIRDGNGDHPYGMLALPLTPDAFEGGPWTFRYSEVLNIDPEEVDAFDQAFPPKEKGYHYSQEIFGMAFRAFLR